MKRDFIDVAGGASAIVAILRGIAPSQVLSICETLIEQGISMIEVPLNSPDPFVSIERAVSEFKTQALIGAGTVLGADDVVRLAGIGAELIVAPNFNPDVVAAAIERDMVALPGVMTPTEVFAAHSAGATGAKIFPARGLGAGHIKDLSAVLPRDFPLIAVGGVDADNIGQWLAAGAAGVGVGSSLYKPGDDAATVKQRAAAIVKSFKHPQI